MPALVHTTFRVSNAKQFKESFEEKKENGIGGYIPASLYTANSVTFEPELTSNVALADATRIPTYALDDQIFLFIGRVSRWTEYDDPANEVDGTINANLNENNPPFPVDSMKDSHFNHWDDMIAAKRVSDQEVSHVIKRERADEIKAGVRNWKTGLRYDEFDSRDDTMFDDDMLIHTLNEKFRVYKCLKRGVGRFTKFDAPVANTIQADYKTAGNTVYLWNYQSSREPLERDISCDPPNGNITEDFMTAGTAGTPSEFNDGYQWKYFYTIDAGQALKFVTTSYIPVKRLRKENGSIVDDSSDQYVVENASIPGAILNVVALKKEANGFDSSGVRYGYDTRGGDGYFQLAAKNADINFDPSADLLEFKFAISNVDPAHPNYLACDWPEEDVAERFASVAVGPNSKNRFDFVNAGQAANWIGTSGAMVGYGVVIKASSIVAAQINPGATQTPDSSEWKKYVFPIQTNSIVAGINTVTIDPAFVEHLHSWAAGAGTIKKSQDGLDGLEAYIFNLAGLTDIEIHPIVKIDSNFQSTTVSDKVDAFQAYAIVEPIFDPTIPGYDGTNPGRIIDARVTNPGRYHYRVDRTYLSPDVANTALNNWTLPVPNVAANTAVMWACVPPVGGHGWDPVEELGGFNVMINARFEGDEADEFTVKNEFRKIGILKNPLSYTANNDINQLWMSDASADPNAYTELFREYKTDQCYRVHLDGAATYGFQSGAGPLFFEPDMEVAFEATAVIPSVATASGLSYNPGDVIATARVVDHDTIQHRLRLIKPRADWGTILVGGSFTVNSITTHSVTGENVVGNTDGTFAANTAEEPKMKPGSGKILYIENRSMVSRSPNQTEDLKISIQF